MSSAFRAMVFACVRYSTGGLELNPMLSSSYASASPA